MKIFCNDNLEYSTPTISEEGDFVSGRNIFTDVLI